ncbi:formylglycine-generating enzyme family protein [Phaeodactylibacter xiamenensis]|uniref:formylglycine-generating enzyme family protein n=1 Tax=Phaeodactylibacter xiamenensis TaxID=1524460 RepID=UPI0024A9D455|nr:formylglycine-generating enzyme family protein [Phaeodactylibacter xiamenensis]
MPQPEIYEEHLPGGMSFEMIKVEGGTFKRGEEQQLVTVPGFYIGKYPVTQAVWTAIMKENPSYFKGINHPVERVNWEDVQAFLKNLYGLTGEKYRLPSEAEWEYAARGGEQIRMDAARGGKSNQGLQYAGSNKLKEVGWSRSNSNGQTQPVGLKLSNELDLYDMSGNVWEWCADHWHENHEGAPVDGSAWITGGNKDRRVVRGGSWIDDDNDCRPSYRDRYNTNNRLNYIGFRLARYHPPER